MTKLFEDFNAVSDQEWIDKISKDLKGKTAAEIAKSRPYEGFDLKVFYTKNDADQPLEVIMDHDWKISDDEDFIENTMADPINHLMTSGDWMTGEEETDFEQFESVFKSEIKSRNIGIYGRIYQLAGASANQELALTLSHINEYFHFLKSKKILSKDVLGSLSLRIGIGSDYFMEIAKFRALRILVRQLAKSYDLTDDIPISIYAKNGLLAFSANDPDTNILRTTTACMSAVIGGCDHLILVPHDRLNTDFHDFGDRIARNIQLMMKHEAHLDKVNDAGSGSYYIEWLTKELAKKAWDQFKEIEKSGGLIEEFKKGNLQKMIRIDAEKRIEAFKDQKDIFIGINKFQNPKPSENRKPEQFISGGTYEALKPLILENTI